MVLNRKNKGLRQILAPILVSFILLISGYILLIPFIRNLMIENRKKQAREMVMAVYHMIENYPSLSEIGKLDSTQVQLLIRESVRNMRYGAAGKDYIWILDGSGNIIAHPFFNDSTASARQDYYFKGILRQIVSMASAKDESYQEYFWQKNDDTTLFEKKISFVKKFKKWDWYIGTGFYEKELQATINKITYSVGSVMVIITLLIIIQHILIVHRVNKNIEQIKTNEQNLIQSEQRFRGMAGNIHHGLIILENDKLIFFNQKALEILGIPEGEISKKTFFDIIAPEERDRIFAYLDESKTSDKELEDFSCWIVRKDKTRRFINNYFSYEIRDNNKYTYILIADSTEQKLIERQLSALSELVNQSPDSTVITDLDGNITYVNKTFEIKTGYSFSEVQGKNPRVLKSEQMHPSIFADLWKTISSGEVWKHELLNKKKNGELFWEYTIVFPIRNEQGEIVNYAAIKNDLTLFKQLEQELIQSKERAETGEKIKTAFLRNISHEVRTPLNAINGFSALLKTDKSLNDTARSYLSYIHSNSETLLKLFQDILDYSRIESGSLKFQRKEIPLYSSIREVINKYEEELKKDTEKTVQICLDQTELNATVSLITDIEWFAKILDNLVSNAVKFTKTGSIHIGFNIGFENIVFYVKDTGIGIPENDQKVMFNTFTHGETLFVSLHKGTGMGLNISKLLVEQMGGKLWYTSQEGIGSTFYFSLPSLDVRNYILGKEQINPIPYNHLLKDKKILVAEHNDESFIYLKNMLEDEGTYISRAKSATETLNILEKNTFNYDLVLLDVFLPDQNMIDIVKVIRSESQKLPLIGISNSNYLLADILHPGYNSFLIKPFQKKQLYQTIYHVFNEESSS